jgi:hypothetical protein
MVTWGGRHEDNHETVPVLLVARSNQVLVFRMPSVWCTAFPSPLNTCHNVNLQPRNLGLGERLESIQAKSLRWIHIPFLVAFLVV